MKAVYISPEAVTEILTALYGAKSQLGEVANLSDVIKLLETAKEAPRSVTEITITGEEARFIHREDDPTGTNWPWTEERIDAAEHDGVDDMPPMPPRLDGEEDDKAGGLVTMARNMLKNSALGDSGRPRLRREERNELKGYTGLDRT